MRRVGGEGNAPGGVRVHRRANSLVRRTLNTTEAFQLWQVGHTECAGTHRRAN